MATDKFGNEYKVVGCKDKKGSGFSKGFIEITRPGLYKLEPSAAQKEGVDTWIRVTKMAQQRGAGGSFGGRGRGGFGGQRRGL